MTEADRKRLAAILMHSDDADERLAAWEELDAIGVDDQPQDSAVGYFEPSTGGWVPLTQAAALGVPKSLLAQPWEPPTEPLARFGPPPPSTPKPHVPAINPMLICAAKFGLLPWAAIIGMIILLKLSTG